MTCKEKNIYLNDDRLYNFRQFVHDCFILIIKL